MSSDAMWGLAERGMCFINGTVDVGWLMEMFCDVPVGMMANGVTVSDGVSTDVISLGEINCCDDWSG